MRLRARAALGALLSLTACDSSVDRQRITICRRALPALVPVDLAPRLLHVGRGSVPDSVRLDYETGSRPHRIECQFGDGAGLAGIVIDHKAVTGGSLYLLKRYYLDTPDAERNDPGQP